MHPREFDVGLDEPSIARLAQRAGAGEIVTFETRHRRKDGTTFPVEIRTGTFKQGGKLFYLALARDISERKLAEETLREKDNALQMARTELARVSRLTTLGELTTSIAHEVSQPLGAMVASAGACARWLAADPPAMAEARSALDNIVADGKRAREVIARIRALAKRQAPRMDLLDLNRKILEVLALTEQELRSHDIVLETQARTDAAARDGRSRAAAAGASQPDRERDRGNERRARSPARVDDRFRRDGPDAVVVEVRDSGIGLDPERAERVFEAFYTTKAEGIGIGLSISRSIVEAHGGRLWAAPNEPHGAVFRFSLPVAEDGHIMSEERAVVFVVDDDPSMRRSLETLLRSVGLDVRLFSSAQEFMQAERPGRTGLPRARRAAARHERTRRFSRSSRKQGSLSRSSSSPGTATFR